MKGRTAVNRRIWGIALAGLLAVAGVAGAASRASADDVEQRIAEFWRRIDALRPNDYVSAGDLGQWALNVTERDPGAAITVADFRASTTAMQAAFDRAGAGVPPGTPKSSDVEDRIARFWQKVDALGPADLLAAADVGQWALNVTDRDPNKRIRLDDFRASTTDMQGGLDRARSLPRPATPTPTPGPTATQAPTATPRPTPAPVTLPAQSLVVSASDYPGYALSRDSAWRGTGWQRQFSTGGEYSYVEFYVDVYAADADMAKAVTDQGTCDIVFGDSFTPRRVSVPAVGIGTTGCIYKFAGNILPWIQYVTATRNVLIQVRGTPTSTKTDAELIALMGDLARRQIAVIDQKAPPGATLSPATPTPAATAAPTPASGAKIAFTAPARLPDATVGVEYEYSFCQPRPATRTTACGPFPATTNPTGGQPPYHFQLGSGVGFPPIGCSLLKDGHLYCERGPTPGTEGRTYTFSVCAVDLAGDQVCITVSIFVAAGTAPTPADPAAVALAITSKTCTPSSIPGLYDVIVTGTGTGPVGASFSSSAFAITTANWTSGRRRQTEPATTTWTTVSRRVNAGAAYVIYLENNTVTVTCP